MHAGKIELTEVSFEYSCTTMTTPQDCNSVHCTIFVLRGKYYPRGRKNQLALSVVK